MSTSARISGLSGSATACAGWFPGALARSRFQRRLRPTSVCQPYVEGFLQKVRDGGDLVPHQSKRVRLPKTKDDMLLDFGLHHFHLDTEKKTPADRFTRRTQHAAIAWVADEIFYLVDIVEHLEAEGWQDIRFLEIVHREWRHLTAPFQVSGSDDDMYTLTAPTEPIGPKERRQRVRDHDQSVPVYLDCGAVLLPPGLGQSLAGIGLHGMHRLMDLRQLAKHLEEQALAMGLAGTLHAQLRPDGAEIRDGTGRVVYRAVRRSC